MATSKIESTLVLKKDFTKSGIEIASNGFAVAELSAADIAVSGYKPIGIMGVTNSGSGRTFILIYEFGLLSSGGLRVGLRNFDNSTRTIAITVTVLYIREQ